MSYPRVPRALQRASAAAQTRDRGFLLSGNEATGIPGLQRTASRCAAPRETEVGCRTPVAAAMRAVTTIPCACSSHPANSSTAIMRRCTRPPAAGDCGGAAGRKGARVLLAVRDIRYGIVDHDDRRTPREQRARRRTRLLAAARRRSTTPSAARRASARPPRSFADVKNHRRRPACWSGSAPTCSWHGYAESCSTSPGSR